MSRGMNDDEEHFIRENYQLRDLLIGIIFFLFGGFMLLKNITIYSFGFSRWFGDATGGIMIITFAACFMVMVIKPNFITETLCVLSVIAIIINMILGTRMVFKSISMVELIVMIMLFFGGLAFILKVLLTPQKRNRNGRRSGGRYSSDNSDDIARELDELKKNM